MTYFFHLWNIIYFLKCFLSVLSVLKYPLSIFKYPLSASKYPLSVSKLSFAATIIHIK